MQQSILHKGLPKDQWVTPEQVRLDDIFISASRTSMIGADRIFLYLSFQSILRYSTPHQTIAFIRIFLPVSVSPFQPHRTSPLRYLRPASKSTGHPIHDPLRPPSRSREQRAGILRQHRGREEEVDVLPYSKRMICGGAVGNGCRRRAQKLCRVIYITIWDSKRFSPGSLGSWRR